MDDVIVEGTAGHEGEDLPFTQCIESLVTDPIQVPRFHVNLSLLLLQLTSEVTGGEVAK